MVKGKREKRISERERKREISSEIWKSLSLAHVREKPSRPRKEAAERSRLNRPPSSDMTRNISYCQHHNKKTSWHMRHQVEFSERYGFNSGSQLVINEMMFWSHLIKLKSNPWKKIQLFPSNCHRAKLKNI